MQIDKIHPARVQELNDKSIDRSGQYVLYWMQQSQRSHWNHALELAIQLGQQLDQAVVVGFGLMDDYPEANARHYTFLLEGLQEVEEALKERQCKLVLRRGHPAETALELGQKASVIVCDRGYLRHQRAWREQVAEGAACKAIQVECDAVVPVEEASDKQEYAARTIRKKLMGQYEAYLEDPHSGQPPKDGRYLNVTGESLDDIPGLLSKMNIDHSVAPASQHFRGGMKQGQRVFRQFLDEHLPKYESHRNQAQTDHVSYMSMYLHFGQVAPAWLIREVKREAADNPNTEAFIEELLVRRELGINYCYYHPQYDEFGKLGRPGWAKETLEEHARDEREYLYSAEELEKAQTHDPYWNAAMMEMKYTGYMHNYMRMYWGKQILAWSPTPEEAYERTLYLNNKYFLDGRDCNSFTNVAWLFGLHDRAWQERPVFGKVRIMTQNGLKNKFKPEKYVEKIARRTGRPVAAYDED